MLKFDFDEVSEYEHHLLGLDRRRSSDNQLLDLVDNYFDKHAPDLEFAIVETTAIGHLGSIGETHLFGDYTKVGFIEARTIYHELVKQMADKYGSTPADYAYWYNRDSSFICINNTGSKGEAKHPHWFHDHDHARKSTSTKEINVPEKDRLNFSSFLSDYAQQLTERFSLYQFPHFCIIVKPISIKRTDTAKTTYVPVGNFYLAFAAKTHKNKEFYLDLINLLCYVWLNCNWQELVSKLGGLAAEPEEHVIPRLPATLQKAFKTQNLFHGHSLETLHKAYFKQPDVNGRVEERYQKVIRLAFDYFTGDYQNGNHMKSELEYLIRNGGKSALKKSDYNDVFLSILGSRVFCMIAMHVFKVNCENLAQILMKGNYDAKEQRSDHTIYTYFHDQRWLPPQSSDFVKRDSYQEKIRNHMLSTFSIFDIKVMYFTVNIEMQKLSESCEFIPPIIAFKKELLNNLPDSDRKTVEMLANTIAHQN